MMPNDAQEENREELKKKKEQDKVMKV